jgi:Transcriptional regulators
MPVAEPNSTPDPGSTGHPGVVSGPTLSTTSASAQGTAPPFPAIDTLAATGNGKIPADDAEDPTPFVTAVIDLIRAVRRTGGSARVLGDQGISLSQLVVLSAVATAGRRGVSAVAEEAGLAQPSVTRTLDVLHRRGLVRRDRHPGDGRSTRLALTDEGARLVGGKTAEVRQRLAELWQDLSP